MGTENMAENERAEEVWLQSGNRDRAIKIITVLVLVTVGFLVNANKQRQLDNDAKKAGRHAVECVMQRVPASDCD